ncbi:hypothetical protein ACF0H5_016837 [Mactra antiquata]
MFYPVDIDKRVLSTHKFLAGECQGITLDHLDIFAVDDDDGGRWRVVRCDEHYGYSSNPSTNIAGLVPTALPAYQAAYGRGLPTAFAPAGYYYPGMEILDLGQWYPF